MKRRCASKVLFGYSWICEMKSKFDMKVHQIIRGVYLASGIIKSINTDASIFVNTCLYINIFRFHWYLIHTCWEMVCYADRKRGKRKRDTRMSTHTAILNRLFMHKTLNQKFDENMLWCNVFTTSLPFLFHLSLIIYYFISSFICFEYFIL